MKKLKFNKTNLFDERVYTKDDVDLKLEERTKEIFKDFNSHAVHPCCKSWLKKMEKKWLGEKE